MRRAGPIFVYNASFETARIRELSERFPRMAKSLLALNERVVDLLLWLETITTTQANRASWSIKAVPALCPDLDYGDLDGVQDGGMAWMPSWRLWHRKPVRHAKAKMSNNC